MNFRRGLLHGGDEPEWSRYNSLIGTFSLNAALFRRYRKMCGLL